MQVSRERESHDLAPARRAVTTLLVVDDDPRILDAYRRGVARVPAPTPTVHAASTAATALALARAHAIDAAIVDFRLGDDSGLELVAALRALAPTATIVLVSGYASMELGAEAIRAGADHAIAKPVAIADLLRRIAGEPWDPGSAAPATDEDTRWEHMQRVLLDCRGNRSEAARRLGIDRSTLLRWLARRAAP